MISITENGPVKQERLIAYNDPFQLSTPCWRKSTWSQLPPETINTTKGTTPMPITKVALSSVPARKSTGAVGSPITEITEVMDALKTLKPTEAIRLTLSTETTKRLSEKKNGKPKIPARALIATLRRKFATQGLDFTAYTIDDKEVIVTKKAK